MSQSLPTGDFREESLDYEWRDLNEERGCILEVDVEYPKEVHDFLSDLPPLPDKLKIKEEMLSDVQKTLYIAHHGEGKTFSTTEKLIPTLLKKEKYIVHQRLLKQAEELGCTITNIHSIISFRQAKWLAPYITFNTQKRSQPDSSDFERNMYKLMNNSVYGKTMENVRKHRDFKFIDVEHATPKTFRNPKIYAATEIGLCKILLELRRTEAEMNKPLYIGMCILDLSKVFMYDFHYNFTKKLLPGAELMYMDTDSFIYKVPKSHNEMMKVLKAHEDLFDFSEYPTDHPNYSDKNKKVIGKMKDETHSKRIMEFVGLRSKMYSCLIEGGKNIRKAKGVDRIAVKKQLTHSDYLSILQQSDEHRKTITVMQQNIISRQQRIYTTENKKLGLAPFDDKRYLIGNIETLPHGHYKLW